MARRIRPETAIRVAGIRGVQAAKYRSDLAKLPTATDVYDFRAQRAFLEQQITALETGGDDVHVQSAHLADELLPMAGLKSRFDRSGPRCWRITGDELVPEDHERVVWTA